MIPNQFMLLMDFLTKIKIGLPGSSLLDNLPLLTFNVDKQTQLNEQEKKTKEI